MQSILPCASPNVIYKSSIYRICVNFWSQICLCLLASIEQMGKYWESNLPAWKLMHSSLPCWVVLVPMQHINSNQVQDMWEILESNLPVSTVQDMWGDIGVKSPSVTTDKLMQSSLPCWVVLVPLQTSSSSNWRPLRRQPREEQKGRAFIYVVCILYRVSHIEMDKVNWT